MVKQKKKKAGRPKKEPTKVMRVPMSLVEHVDLLIYQKKFYSIIDKHESKINIQYEK